MDIQQKRLAALRAIIGEESQRDFADKHDLDASYLSQLLNEHRKIGERAAANLEKKIGLVPGTLVAPGTIRYDPAKDSASLSVAYSMEAAAAEAGHGGIPYDARRLLPVIGNVRAGDFCEAVDNFQPGDADEWVEAGGPAGPRAFVLIVEGLSMYPLLAPNDRVVMDPDFAWTTGSIVLAKRMRDHNVTIKQLCKEGSDWFLHATNPDWPEKYIKLNEEWMVCARARRKIVEL